jgi:single-strand DNA-binding protein
MNFNKVILVGNVTRDPELRVLPSGQNVANFGLATNRFFNDKSGARQQQTEFHNIVIFGKMADTAGQYLKKGSTVLIEGRLQTRSWQDATGVKKYRTEIVTESMQLGPRLQGQGGPEPLAPGYSQDSAKQPETATKPSQQPEQEDIPIIEENDDIDVKNIPF